MERVQKITQRYIDYSLKLISDVAENNIPFVSFIEKRLPAYYSYFDDVLEIFNQEAPGPVTCGAHCGACCSSLVFISPIEAVNLWFHLKKDYSDEQLTDLMKQLKYRVQVLDNIRQIGHNDHDRISTLYAKKRLACLFLKADQNCGVHAFRPSICRNHHVITPPEWCSDLDNIEALVRTFARSCSFAEIYAELISFISSSRFCIASQRNRAWTTA